MSYCLVYEADNANCNTNNAWADPEAGGGAWVRTPPPGKSHHYRVFFINTGPDPLKNYNATKPALNVGPSSTRQRNAI